MNPELEQGAAAFARYQESGDLDDTALLEALRLLTEAVETEPTLGEAWLERSRVYRALEEFEDADRDLTCAQRLLKERADSSPVDWRARFLLGRALALGTAEQRRDAIPHLHEAARLAPAEAVVWEELGWLLAAEGLDGLGEVVSVATQGMEHAGPTAELLLLRGDAHHSLGNLGEALDNFDKGIALAPNDWRFYNRRAELLMQLAQRAEHSSADARWDAAALDYARCRELEPNRAATALPDLRLSEPPPVLGGPVFDLFLEEPGSPPAGAEATRPMRQLPEAAFVEFARVFDFEGHLRWHGRSRYVVSGLRTLAARLAAHRSGRCHRLIRRVPPARDRNRVAADAHPRLRRSRTTVGRLAARREGNQRGLERLRG